MSRWRPAYFHLKQPDFFWRPQIFIGDPIFSLDPQYFCWRPPDSRWCLHQKNGVSNENLGVFNENMAVSKENIGVSNENMGVSNKNLGVSNKNMEVSNKNLGAFNKTSMGSPIVLQWWWFLLRHSLSISVVPWKFQVIPGSMHCEHNPSMRRRTGVFKRRF